MFTEQKWVQWKAGGVELHGGLLPHEVDLSPLRKQGNLILL